MHCIASCAGRVMIMRSGLMPRIADHLGILQRIGTRLGIPEQIDIRPRIPYQVVGIRLPTLHRVETHPNNHRAVDIHHKARHRMFQEQTMRTSNSICESQCYQAEWLFSFLTSSGNDAWDERQDEWFLTQARRYVVTPQAV